MHFHLDQKLIGWNFLKVEQQNLYRDTSSQWRDFKGESSIVQILIYQCVTFMVLPDFYTTNATSTGMVLLCCSSSI